MVVTTKKIPRNIIEKANEIYLKLLNGCNYRFFKGKKISKNKSYVSIKLGYHYRFLCKIIDHQILPVLVSNHDKYDRFLKKMK